MAGGRGYGGNGRVSHDATASTENGVPADDIPQRPSKSVATEKQLIEDGSSGENAITSTSNAVSAVNDQNGVSQGPFNSDEAETQRVGIGTKDGNDTSSTSRHAAAVTTSNYPRHFTVKGAVMTGDGEDGRDCENMAASIDNGALIIDLSSDEDPTLDIPSEVLTNERNIIELDYDEDETILDARWSG